MFLKKLDISKKQSIILGIFTLVFIVALGIFIGLLDIEISDSGTDLDFLGYQFTASTSKVDIKTPLDPIFSVEINDDTIHELETLSSTINTAHDRWISVIRNSMIFIYLVLIIILLFKKKETYFQGAFKGFLIGASLLLFLFIVNGIFELNSQLISFSHHISHMIFPG